MSPTPLQESPVEDAPPAAETSAESPVEEPTAAVADDQGEEDSAEAADGGREGAEESGGETAKEMDGEAVEGISSVAGVHKGKDNWTAVWDGASNAYYFHNTLTNEVTWTNPLEAAPTASTSSSSIAPGGGDGRPLVDYGGIDPELAYLDPNLARASTSGSAAPSFQARFNSRTGRFQGDPSMNPDRISDYSRGTRQQDAYYDTSGWTASLDGKGLKRGAGGAGAVEDDGPRKKKPSAKEVEKFRQKKVDKKRAKLMDFLK